MKFIWWAAKGPGPIEYQEGVENDTGNDAVLWPQRDLLNVSVKPERETVLWRLHKDGGAPAVRKALFLDRLVDGAAHEAPIMSGGQGGGFGFIPFVALDGGTHGAYCAGEWQDGVMRAAAEGPRPVRVGVKLPARMDHTDVPGPRAELPAVYFGAYAGDMDDCGNGFKRWFFLLKGLNRAKTYALNFEDRPAQNVRTTGAKLMDQGFDVTMTGQNVSEIVWVEEAPLELR